MALADAIREVKERVRPCVECFGLAEDERCPICADARRDRTLICVVESPQDTEPIERTAAFRGVYHVLGGALSPMDGVDPDDLRIAELVRRVDERRRGGGHPRDQPHDDRRGDRELRRQPAAREARASRGWPAACPWAATWSSPTR